MIRPNFEKWNQTAEDMRRLSITAAHPRSRERFQALYMIGIQQKSASQWAKEIDRQKQTVLGWVHDYNEAGPDSIPYQHTGGRQSKLNEAEKKDHRDRNPRYPRRPSIAGVWLDGQEVADLG